MSRGEEAARYIRSLIFDGELRPGSRVPQDDIAHSLGVSRIPVREALIALEREGWVTIELNRGAFVNALDAQAVLDHYELYGMIYGFAARRALDHEGGPELIRRLEQIVRDLHAVDDPSQVLQHTLAFQKTVLDAAHSPRLRPLTRALTQLVPGDFFSLVPEAVDLERKGLRAITRALKRGDGEKAAAEWARMSHRIGERVLALLEQRGLLSAGETQVS
jgi:DNA-binding GntR family transcriptional regulator